jgi:hypothetical protein
VLTARETFHVGQTSDPKIPDPGSAAADVPVVAHGAAADVPVIPAGASDTAELDPQFQPLRPASRRQLLALFIIGPLLWVGAAVTVAYVVHHGEAIGIALIVLAASSLLALVTLLPMRAGRVRAERKR